MTTDPPDKPAASGWTWPTGPEDHAGASAAPGELSTSARRIGWYIVGSGLVVMFAAVLPWKSAPERVNGIAGDGILTLAFGLVAVVVGVARVLSRWQSRWQITWAIVALFVAAFTTFIAYTDVQSVAQIATVGIGLVITLLGGFAMLGAAVTALLRRT